ncbi:DNA-binding IclR family transcriptional regulator [Mumia flava]|uniref:Glycerol operon regulatory protein n=1 Tax=Mumia flava TaxID=1348852 RepID=A0A0B2BVP7_9ACTN|nr:IclR family transcriptional regulator [Mumia flava]PJJ58111.1 DNA-binding IclR family transcriptional regulator [Mumia flava]
MSEARAAAGRVRAVDRSLDVLELLATTRRPYALSEVARELEVPKSTMLGILRTMESRGWLVEAGGAFALGPRSLVLGTAYADTDFVASRAGVLLDQVLASIGETVHLACLDGADVLYLAKRESTHPLRMFSAIGRRLPAHATALGKAMLATLSDEAIDELLPRPLPRLTDATLVEREDLFVDLRQTRSQGYAIDRGENADGIECWAVALDVDAAVPYAVSVSIPTLRIDADLPDRVVQVLRAVQADAVRLGRRDSTA